MTVYSGVVEGPKLAWTRSAGRKATSDCNCFLLPTRRSRQEELHHEFDKSRVGLLYSGVEHGRRLPPFPSEYNTFESPSLCDPQKMSIGISTAIPQATYGDGFRDFARGGVDRCQLSRCRLPVRGREYCRPNGRSRHHDGGLREACRSYGHLQSQHDGWPRHDTHL